MQVIYNTTHTCAAASSQVNPRFLDTTTASVCNIVSGFGYFLLPPLQV